MAYWTTRDWDIILSTDERRFAEIFFMIEAEREERPYEDGLAAFFAKARIDTAIALGTDADTDTVY